MTSLERIRARALATAYGLLYGPLAWAYDAVAWLASDGRWWRWQEPVLERLAPGPVLSPSTVLGVNSAEGRVLEIGCGTGHLLAHMTALGHHSYGVDRSRTMLRRARDTLRRRHESAPLVQADARFLPLLRGTFHSVLLCFTGLSGDPAVLAEAKRVLAPGGQLVVLEEVLPRDAKPLARLAAWVQGSQSRRIAASQSLPFRQAGLSWQREEVVVDGSIVKLLTARKERP